MGIGSRTVTVKVKNLDKFNELTNEFRQKALELDKLAHELSTFDFEGEITSR